MKKTANYSCQKSRRGKKFHRRRPGAVIRTANCPACIRRQPDTTMMKARTFAVFYLSSLSSAYVILTVFHFFFGSNLEFNTWSPVGQQPRTRRHRGGIGIYGKRGSHKNRIHASCTNNKRLTENLHSSTQQRDDVMKIDRPVNGTETRHAVPAGRNESVFHFSATGSAERRQPCHPPRRAMDRGKR